MHNSLKRLRRCVGRGKLSVRGAGDLMTNRKAKVVTKTAKGLRRQNEEQSRLLVRESEMSGLADFYDVPDRELWDIGPGNRRGSRRA